MPFSLRDSISLRYLWDNQSQLGLQTSYDSVLRIGHLSVYVISQCTYAIWCLQQMLLAHQAGGLDGPLCMCQIFNVCWLAGVLHMTWHKDSFLSSLAILNGWLRAWCCHESRWLCEVGLWTLYIEKVCLCCLWNLLCDVLISDLIQLYYFCSYSSYSSACTLIYICTYAIRGHPNIYIVCVCVHACVCMYVKK